MKVKRVQDVICLKDRLPCMSLRIAVILLMKEMQFSVTCFCDKGENPKQRHQGMNAQDWCRE